MSTPHVWIVEMEQRGKWLPCGGMDFNKQDALRDSLPFWKGGNTDDKFRVSKYARVEVTP